VRACSGAFTPSRPFGAATTSSSSSGTIIRCIRELRCGTVNVREVPGFRTEETPFGGVKSSGLGAKEA
jgi:aldehyde dehydrogenase (NAD+)